VKLAVKAAATRSEFFAPAPLAAVALVGLNDHLWKPRFHNAVTGKLTDVALCFFFPLLLSVLLRPLWRADRGRLLFAAAATALLFTALELSAAADAALTAAVAVVGRSFGVGLAPFTRDLTDLLALGMVPVAYWYGRRRTGKAARPWSWASARASWWWRAPALAGTLVLLTAESPLLCDEYSAPVPFRVSDGCGAAGIMVVESNSETGHLDAFNGDALVGAATGRYQGGECPFRLDQGGWYLVGTACPAATPDGGLGPDAGGSGDAGASADASASAGPAGCPESARRRCEAKLENGELWLSCSGAGPTCRARLTVEAPSP
jgi:hypothetical protein